MLSTESLCLADAPAGGGRQHCSGEGGSAGPGGCGPGGWGSGEKPSSWVAGEGHIWASVPGLGLEAGQTTGQLWARQGLCCLGPSAAELSLDPGLSLEMAPALLRVCTVRLVSGRAVAKGLVSSRAAGCGRRLLSGVAGSACVSLSMVTEALGPGSAPRGLPGATAGCGGPGPPK